MKKLLSLLFFLLLVISCKQKDDAANGFTKYDIVGRWEVNYFDEALLNLDGSGTYLNFAVYEHYPLTWDLEGNVLEMSYEAHGKTKCYKIRVDSVTTDSHGSEEFRRLHVTPLCDAGFKDSWREIK